MINSHQIKNQQIKFIGRAASRGRKRRRREAAAPLHPHPPHTNKAKSTLATPAPRRPLKLNKLNRRAAINSTPSTCEELLARSAPKAFSSNVIVITFFSSVNFELIRFLTS